MENRKFIIIAAAFMLIIGGLLFLNNKTGNKIKIPGRNVFISPTVTVSKVNDSILLRSIVLESQNDSGENGIALIQEKEGKLSVSLRITGSPSGTIQPAHIHLGSCGKMDDVLYPLSNLVNGESETIIDTTFKKLYKDLPLAVNVHKSEKEANIYVSCGNIPSK